MKTFILLCDQPSQPKVIEVLPSIDPCEAKRVFSRMKAERARPAPWVNWVELHDDDHGCLEKYIPEGESETKQETYHSKSKGKKQ